MRPPSRRPLGWPLPLLVAALALLLAACGGGGAGEAPATGEPISVGMIYDATGPVSNLLTPARQAVEDYFNLVNKRGGIDGHPVRASYCDAGYEVARGVNCYEQFKREGVVVFYADGSAIGEGVASRAAADRLPGFVVSGPGAYTNSERAPYMFAAIGGSRWSQAAASVKVVLDAWKKEGRSGQPRVAYLYIDSVVGRDSLEVLNRLSQQEGFELRTFAIPPPAIDVAAQMTDIVQRYRADYIIADAFGRTPAPVIKAAKDLQFPLEKIVFYTFGIGDAHVRAVGSWDQVQGFQGVGTWLFGPDLPIVQEIREMYQREGKSPPSYLTEANYEYCYGLAIAAIIEEALRQALKAHGWPLDGEKVKQGMESIRGEPAGIIRLQTSPRDHEGGGYVRLLRVQGDRFVPVTDWFNAYRDVVEEVAGIRQ